MNTTIAWITARGLFGRRRFLLLLPLPVILVGMAGLGWAIGQSADLAGPVLVGIGVAVVLPVIALIVGTAVLGSEIDDGTIVHILTKPIPRWKIVLSKLAVAFGVSGAVVAAAMFVAGTIVDGVRFGLAFAAASAVGALAYSALFLLLSLLTRRPVLIGLMYVMIWEGLLGNFVSGTKVLSVQQYVVSLADRWAATELVTGTVSMGVAVTMSAVFTVVGTWLAINRLRLFSVAGETS
ncbi:ABC transporter permease subunit [Allorhizocola rhizosphaerae]|uniref:ABC transporter permease subunit n=1 Tax=Allorhizocola rhizosphaerae TaxID=1872709 RepID=UPI000E3E9CA7|nr:ABC transporter permease [Allorhizocola rhizosphaerae]